MMRIKRFFFKLTHWEFWNMHFLYFPVYFQWLYFVARSRSFFFFEASNPCMHNGGMFMVSKYEICKILPEPTCPATLLIAPKTPIAEIHERMQTASIGFPFFAKPDIGMRGIGVKKIRNQQELDIYHAAISVPYLIQNTIPYDKEVGIFYVRYPNETKGRVTGMVYKEFLTVVGDGKSTIRQLLSQNMRHAIYIDALEKEYGESLNTVVPDQEHRQIVPVGNHARGTTFRDYTSKITDELRETMQRLCDAIPDFYYGRFDIMFDNFEDLAKGEKMQIVELNGAMSEPTHIYDPTHSIFFAWREMLRHHKMLFDISMQNHKKGFPLLNFAQARARFRQHKDYMKIILADAAKGLSAD
jgi:hypothetical protein